jgi:hypothetical protein
MNNISLSEIQKWAIFFKIKGSNGKSRQQLLTLMKNKNYLNWDSIYNMFLFENNSFPEYNYNLNYNPELTSSCMFDYIINNSRYSNVAREDDVWIFYDNNDPVVYKIFQDGTSSIDLNISEYIIMRTIIPFFYYQNLSFNFLFPTTIGKCIPTEVKTAPSQVNKILNGNDENSQLYKHKQNIYYIGTEFCLHSFDKIIYNPQYIHHIPTYLFQILYSILVMDRFGLNHGDLHPGNVRIKDNVPSHVVNFKIDENTNYSLLIKNSIPVIMDFDYTGIFGTMSKLLKLYKLGSTNPFIEKQGKNELNLSNNSTGGRRDLLIFFTNLYAFVYYEKIEAMKFESRLNSNISSNEKTTLITKWCKRVGIKYPPNDVKEVLNRPQWKIIFTLESTIIKFLLTITKGPLKEYFINVSKNQIKITNTWVHDLLYFSKTPEIKLRPDVGDENMMSIEEIMKSRSILKLLQIRFSTSEPERFVSIDVSDKDVETGFRHFMNDYYNV